MTLKDNAGKIKYFSYISKKINNTNAEYELTN